jgi:hypothetical protein
VKIAGEPNFGEFDLLWHAACNIQGKHQKDALKKYKGGNHHGFIKRRNSGGGRVEIRRRPDQHDSYLFITLLAAWFLYALKK